MTVAPLIAMKSTKLESLEAVGKELDRRAHTYVNDVDQSKSHLNVYYRVRKEDEKPMPLEKSLDRRMGELHTKRAIRKDAVKAMGFVISTNNALDDETARKFLDDSLNWFRRRYGSENILAASEHFDEGTPHIHLWLAPVVHDDATGYDRLCAKKLFAPDKRKKNPETGKYEVVAQGTMSQLQEDFWRDVASRYGYERPLDHTKRAKGYRSLQAFKNHEGMTRQLKVETATLKQDRDKAHDELSGVQHEVSEKQALSGELSEQISEKKKQLDHAQTQLNDFSEKVVDEQQRSERLRRDNDAKTEAIADLDRSIAQKKAQSKSPTETVTESLRTLSKARGDGEREEGLTSEVESLRSRVSELEAANQQARDHVSELDAANIGSFER